jgi:hemoglobin-like flavoprotein
MTPDQIRLVQQSFAEVAPIADTAATLFYERLFVIAPAVKPLFHGDTAEQRNKLMATLAAVVAGLGGIETILPVASALARRHVRYDVKPENYAQVGSALLWTLERGLDDGWSSDLAAAWSAAFGTVSRFMIGEAYGRTQATE